MARLQYVEDRVNEAINQLTLSETALSKIQSGMVSGIGLITGARGANYLNTGNLNATASTPDLCIQQVTQLISTIQEKSDAVKKFNSGYESMGFLEKLFSTVGMAATKITQGFFTAGEQIVDGFASAIGMILGGKAKESIGEFVKKDYVGDAYRNFYYNTSIWSKCECFF